MKKVYILKHVVNEDAGTIRDYLKKAKIPFEAVKLYRNELLPNLREVRALVIMGGPMNVDEDDKHAFLTKEKIFLQKAIQENIPCLGVCLGSQLLTRALDARVYKAPQEEVGWDYVKLTPEAAKDPLLSAFETRKLKVLQWHGDTFDLPKGSVHLAKSAVVPNQAYRYGDKIYAFQFHVEVNKPMLRNWFKKHESLKLILKEFDAYKPELQRTTAEFYKRFFAL